MSATDETQGERTDELARLKPKIIEMSHEHAQLLEASAESAHALHESSASYVQHANDTNEEVARACAQVQLGHDAMTQMQQSISELSTLTRRLETVAEVVEGICKRSERINDIAFQSKILAINAEIEAARVGEAGAGFAAVAEAVRGLAKESDRTATEISQSVAQAVDSIRATLRDARTQISKCVERSAVSSAALESMNEQARCISRHADAIVTTAQEQREKARVFEESLRAGSEDYAAGVSDLIGTITGSVITDLSPREASCRNLAVIDVRRGHEFYDAFGHIEGATLMTLGDDFERQLGRLDPATPYLFVCRRGGRSARAARIAQRLGFTELYNLAGGMTAWCEAGLPSTGRNGAPTFERAS